MIDKSLIARCIQNDRKAFEKLYNLTLPSMVVLCRRYRLLESDMEDMLQEIYSELFISMYKYNTEKGAFMPWLKKIGLHTILKGYRKKKLNIVHIETYEHQLYDNNTSIEKLDDLDISMMVDKLPHGYKTILNLIKDGLDHSEISNYLGISKSTSRSQLARAKQMLRNQINSLKSKSI